MSLEKREGEETQLPKQFERLGFVLCSLLLKKLE